LSKLDYPDIGLWTPLFWACYRGHADTVAELVSGGADLNTRGVHQVPGLVWAAGRGHIDVVRLRLEHHAKPDASDKYGTTALIWASRKGHAEAVDMILRAEASVDCVGMYSWTPLLVATRGNYVDIVSMILNHSPNVRGWLHERFRVRFHVRFAANRRCDLVYLRCGVAHGIATVYT
jgi:ankyrin repeat-rich membrane spanning protein